MTVGAILTGVPLGLAGWKLLQTKSPTDFKAFSKDPILQNDLAYLRNKLPTKADAKSLLEDRRLQEIVLKAYGLDAQIGYNGLMRKVLESDPSDKNSTAGRMTDARYRVLAADLNYGASVTAAVPAVPTSSTLQIGWPVNGKGFNSFAGSFGTVQVENVSLEGLHSRGEVAAALQAAFRKADGGRSDITVTQFGLNLIVTDAKGRGAVEFGFKPADGSQARAVEGEGSLSPLTGRVLLSGLDDGRGFTSFSGTFGTVAISDVDLSGLNRPQDIAARLQAAFRKADGGHGDISVAVKDGSLVFTDARNRNLPEFSFTGDSTATVLRSANGTPGRPVVGGAKVADAALLDSIAQKYTQARFEESLGGTSESLRRAVYAKRTLPTITNWYSVIADRNLAAVVQSALGLPESFGRLDVDRQRDVLSQRMDIAEFKDSAKLGKMLERYVAQTSVAEAQALASSNGIVGLVQPISWGGDRFSGASSAALFSILSSR
ncbi:DUF1217 domain-containing protein [Pseudoroseomonas globiformis]|uniref:DUF1217 domain-containing protein n=1 Tax=Teichococcus globiformis TaxID=2307229 RepID=A0ABV7G4L1_9PROT